VSKRYVDCPAPGSWSGTIYGEPASKANSRRLVMFGNRPASIKSEKALNYISVVQQQVPCLSPLLEGPLRFTATIHYASERPDLDESVILDALQGRIYANDRQVRQKVVIKAETDKRNPRAVVKVETIDPGVKVTEIVT